MSIPIVVITGASGFISSAICVNLAKDFIVIAIDRREPSEQLRRGAPQAIWHIIDIADNQTISKCLHKPETILALTGSRNIKDILNYLKTDPKGWEERNISRNEKRFSYSG